MATMEEMMMQEQQAPSMPSMEGANMPPMESSDPMAGLPPEAMEAMMQPDPAIQGVLLARLTNFTKQDLDALDEVITPETAQVLLKLLPEFKEMIDAMASGMQQPEMEPETTGALGGI